VTFEAQLVPGNRRYRVRSAEEDERAFRAAALHSRLVRILRKALPILAVLIFATYFISTRLSITVGGVTASVSGIEVKDGNLRMVKPTLKGVDKKKGAYVISADYADQDMKNPKLVRLHAISAEVNADRNGWSRVNAIRGHFNSESERLVIQDDIHVSTSSGLVGKLSYATIEMDSQIIRAHQPVAFDMPNATLRANALTLRSSESTLTFRGKVHLRIDRSEKKPPQDKGQNTPQVKAPAQPSREPAAPAAAVETSAAPQAAVPSVAPSAVQSVAPSVEPSIVPSIVPSAAPRPAAPTEPVQMPAMPQ